MVFGVDPRSRLKSELTLSEMRFVLVTSRSAITFWLTKPHNTRVGEYCIALLSYFVYNTANIISAENNKNKGIKGELK